MQEALEMTQEEMDVAAHKLLQREEQPFVPKQPHQQQYPKPPPRQNRSDKL